MFEVLENPGDYEGHRDVTRVVCPVYVLVVEQVEDRPVRGRVLKRLEDFLEA